MDGERNPCVTIGFVLECVWRSDWVAFDEVDGRERLLAVAACKHKRSGLQTR